MNYQWWDGFSNPRYGYGRHVQGYRNNAPASVKFDPKASVNVHMGVPWENKGWWKGQYRVLHTMWETDVLPSRWSRYLPFYNLVIVPCQHNVDLFSKHHPNVVKVPEGVDRVLFAPREPARNERFQFHAGGSLWRRKGLDVVVKAFMSLNLPDADLRIKAAPHAFDTPLQPPGPNIYFDREWMSDDEQVAWFARADCFIAASRGEGWGLMPLQTISMGIPTIMSLTTGQREFADLAVRTVPTTPVDSPQFVGRWDEPDMKVLADQMRWVYENRVEALNIARRNAELTDRYTWDKSTQTLLDALPVGKLLRTTTWEPLYVNYTVRALNRIVADIGDLKYRQAKGDVFEVTDGAYQVLFDAGMVELVDVPGKQ